MPPKRQGAPMQSPAKRQRRTLFIGKPNADDALTEAQRSAQQPSSAALSTRVTPNRLLQSLARSSLQAFAEGLPRVLSDSAPVRVREATFRQIKRLPPHLIGPLFAQLRNAHPSMLSHTFIVNNFLQGDAIALSGELTGVGKNTVLAIRDSPAAGTIKSLELRDMPDLTDNVVASVLRGLPSLQTLILRGCAKVGSKSVSAAAATCPDLRIVNFNYCSPDISSLVDLLASCLNVEVLKLAGVACITDNNLGRLIAYGSAAVGPAPLLPNLRVLKLRQTSITSIAVLPDFENGLTSLDVGFTSVVLHSAPSTLTKLSLTSTPLPSHLVLSLLSPLSLLRKLSLAQLGGRTLTLTDKVLRDIIPALAACDDLRELNLAGNAKLGLSGTGVVRDLLIIIGARLEVLNLSAIPRLRSSDLEPFSEVGSSPRLQTLSVSNTGLDDDAAPYIASCPDLRYLNLGGTKFSTEGVGSIVDACHQLGELDLTGCRGVDVLHRRKFFEAWAERDVDDD